MNASRWPGYPVLNYINLFLRSTYMVVFFSFCQVLRLEFCGDCHSAFVVGVWCHVYNTRLHEYFKVQGKM